MDCQPQDPLVSTAWLAERLDAPDIRVVDASWFMPGSERSARKEFELAHIPGAVFFDIDEIADTDSQLPHMLPSSVKFASRVKKLGLGDGVRIVVYDSTGAGPAARVWWMFRAMSHDDVVVLDGGLTKWIAEGRRISDRPAQPRERHFTPRLNVELVMSRRQVGEALSTGSAQVVDARAAARFTGEAPEPRAGLKSGHMPGAKNLPFARLFSPDGLMLPAWALENVFAEAGVDPKRPIIASCGSGVTACLIALALARMGHWSAAVYDGSWTEWASLPDAPIAQGEA